MDTRPARRPRTGACAPRTSSPSTATSTTAGYGTHSLRRTKVALIYKKTGNLRACQLLLGRRNLESTVRYLGIKVDDVLEMSEAIDL
jgi:site-specific recombinase XerC